MVILVVAVGWRRRTRGDFGGGSGFGGVGGVGRVFLRVWWMSSVWGEVQGWEC